MALMEIDRDISEEGAVILKYMNSMIENNRTFLCGVVAPVGKGKSWSCLKWGELWYKFYFNKPFPKENICFSPEQMLKRLDDKGEKKLVKGDVLILEEGGVNVNSRKYMSKVNVALNYVMQSFRSLNVIVFINLPYFSFLDKALRQLQTAVFEIHHVDKKAGETYIKPYFIQTNQWTGQIYKKFLRLKDKKTGKTIKISLVKIGKPSPELVEAYEIMKEAFVRSTIAKSLDAVRSDSLKIAKQINQQNQVWQELTPNQAKVYDKLVEGITRTNDIANLIGFSKAYVSEIKKAIRKKGYFWGNLEQYTQGGRIS